MATWDDVHRIAMALPGAVERGRRDWRVSGKGFACERPLRKVDLDGRPSVLVRLGVIPVGELAELLVEAWLGRAPKRWVTAFLETHPGDSGPW